MGLFHRTTPMPTISAVDQVEIEAPAPQLEANPQILDQVRQHEQQLLEGHGWVDRDAGIARIPIGQAMRILAARGWTSKAEPEGTTADAAANSRGTAP